MNWLILGVLEDGSAPTDGRRFENVQAISIVSTQPDETPWQALARQAEADTYIAELLAYRPKGRWDTLIAYELKEASLRLDEAGRQLLENLAHKFPSPYKNRPWRKEPRPKARAETSRTTVAGFVFVKSDPPKFLILKRNELLGGFWQPVTGRVDKDERLEVAIEREVKEETGLEEFKGIFDLHFSYTFQIGGKKYQEHCFGLEMVREGRVTLSMEHTNYLWSDYPSAMSMLHYKEYKEALEKLYQLITTH